MQFFSTWVVPNIAGKSNPEFAAVGYENIHPIFGAIISAGKANIKQLKYEWTLQEALTTYWIIAVDRENESRYYKSLEKKRGK